METNKSKAPSTLPSASDRSSLPESASSSSAPNTNGVRVQSANIRHPLKPLELLAECERESNQLESRVGSLTKSNCADKKSKEYKSLEELTMRVILKLDTLDCGSDMNLRAERKRIVQHAQRVLDKLERTVDSLS